MNHIATIEIELQSETVFGGDGDQMGTVDIDIQADEYGIPYYSGRTLKGILREQAEWYVECLLKFNKHSEAEKALQRLFGTPDSSDQSYHHSNYTSLRFADAKLSDGIYDFVKKEIKRESLSSQDVLRALTIIRTMTSIDSESGTAKAGSLRQVRAVCPGYRFYAPIYVQGSLNQEERQLLETAVKLVQHIGVMRHRGKGKVCCMLHWNGKQTMNQNERHVIPIVADTEKWEQVNDYITLTIDVHEPLKISHVLGTSDSSHALNYIPGYVLRGALIQAYLQSTGLHSSELDTNSIFDHQQVQFWNGYLMIKGERSLPFIQHVFQTKEQSKKKNAELQEMYNSFDEQEMEKICHLSPVRLSRHVMLFKSGDILLGKNVKKTSALHISVNGNRANRENVTQEKTLVYRYEAIAQEQTFQAIVAVKKNHPFVIWLRQQKELTLWLGGARNSGYGRVTVRTSISKSHPEQSVDYFENIDNFNELYVLATSDWIVQNQQGQLVNVLDAHWLGEQLGVELQLKNQVVNTQISGGYVSQWKAYQPMISAVRAGSVYRYTILSGILDVNKVALLTQQGVGARRNEGFGRLIILPSWPYRKLQEASQEQRSVAYYGCRHSTNDNQQLKQLQKVLVLEKMTEQIREQVAEWYKTLKGVGTITSSQWGKLLQITSDLSSKPEEEQIVERHKERWQKFWADSKERLANKSKLGFDGVWVDNKKLEYFIIDLIDHKWSGNKFIDKNLQINHAEWNMRALELLVRQVVRSKLAKAEGVEIS